LGWKNLGNIFVAYLFHSDDRGTYKINNDKTYRALINELIDLQSNGISICVNSEIHHIYFALGLVLGDNLGLNLILGFVESFSANFYCRICRSPKSALQIIISECHETLKNEVNYATDINTDNYSLTGLKEKFIFNKVPSYHVARNSVCDFMHDLTEGIARYDMALIINNIIDLNSFHLRF